MKQIKELVATFIAQIAEHPNHQVFNSLQHAHL